MYEKNEKGRHLPSALHKSAARPARHRQALLRPPPACATASRPSAPPWPPALSRARPGRRRLRRPDPARARAGDHQPALAMLRAPGSGRRPARHPGPHPGGQLGGPARRGDADLRVTARRRAAARRRPVGGGARCATAPLAGSAGAVPRRHARYPSQPRRRHRHDAGGRRPARRELAAGEQLVRARPVTRTPTWPLAYVHARRNTPLEALYATDRARDLMPGAAYVEREYVFAPAACRMAGAALTHATRRPELYTEAQMRRLQADALAEQVRLASMPTRNEADRFAIADRVLARYDTLIPAWSTQGDETRDDVIRARIDRLHALHARYRMRDLASEYAGAARRGRGRAALRVGRCRFRLSVPAPAGAGRRHLPAGGPGRGKPRRRSGGQAGQPDRPLLLAGRGRGFRRRLQVMDETREGYPACLRQGPAHAHPQRPAPAEHAGRRRRAAAGRRYARGPGAPGRHGAQRPNNSTLKSELAALYRARSLPRARSGR